jgi:hypothetical protein
MNKYVWYGKPWTKTGCPVDGLLPKGWYDGFRLIAETYVNPATGKPYTQLELAAIDCPDCVIPEPVPEPEPVEQNSNALLYLAGIAIFIAIVYGLFQIK